MNALDEMIDKAEALRLKVTAFHCDVETAKHIASMIDFVDLSGAPCNPPSIKPGDSFWYRGKKIEVLGQS